MPTPSEQKALAFVAIVILLGGAVRVVRAGSAAPPSPPEQQALARQALAADSAASSKSANKRTKVAKPRGRTPPRDVGGVSTVPPSFARPDQPYATNPYGFPPPGPRIDIGPAGSKPALGGYVDIDVATATDIETLPRIGPAMARRIVAHRDSFGPYRSLEALGRVKGMGKATLEGLAGRITFGGRRAVP